MNVVLNFYLSRECNFFCDHCMHDCGPNFGNFMNNDQIEFAKNLIMNISSSEHHISVIGFTGGEPLMHPQIFDLFRFFYSRFPLELHTNGSDPYGILDSVPFDLNHSLYRIFVPIDPYHDVFRKKEDILFRKLSVLGPVLIRKNEIIKNKGRASKLIEKENFEKLNSWCVIKKFHGCAFLNFGHDGIRFCGESWDKKLNPKNFVDYDEKFISSPQKLIDLSMEYKNKFSDKNCSHRCMYFRSTDLV